MLARRLSVVAALAILVAAGTVPARADSFVVWLPGSTSAPKMVSATAMMEGDTLTYLNLDAGTHNIVATSLYGSDDNSWCGPIRQGGPRRFPLGQCPIIYSATTGIGQTTTVLGTGALVAGQTVDFHCAPHPWMTGTLVVLPKA
jgi:plastocyanin